MLKKFLQTALAAVISFATICAALPVTVAHAENPIVQTAYTPDPAPLVYNDTFYFYTGHDADGASYFTMTDWRCYSTTDMKNWVDHGAVLSYTDFEWADPDSCWAAQCVERDGKFYLYVTLSTTAAGGARAIGVAVSDSPTGPFKDAIGKPLCGPDWAYIDPTVLIDDDGQAYLYFGNPTLHYVKLKKNMIELDGEITATKMTSEQFGSNENMDSLYTEGPWIYKRNGIYYMVYAASGIPETIDYSTSDSPIGPWKYQGRIMDNCPTSFTIHPGVIEYRDTPISPTTPATWRAEEASPVRELLRSSNSARTARFPISTPPAKVPTRSNTSTPTSPTRRRLSALKRELKPSAEKTVYTSPRRARTITSRLPE